MSDAARRRSDADRLERRGDAAAHPPAATPPSGASGCSASAAVLLSAGFLAFLLVTMLGNGARRLHPDRGAARRRLPALRRCSSIRPRCAAPAPSRRSPTPISSACCAEAATAQYGRRRPAHLLGGARLRAARRGARRSRTCSTGTRDVLAARRRPRSTSPPRATATPRPSELTRGSPTADAIRTGFNWAFLTGVRRHRSDRRSASGARSRARC